MTDKFARKQRLIVRHRLMLFNFACDVFRNPDLRAAEEQAKAAFLEAVHQDIADIPPHEIETFKRYGLISAVNSIRVATRVKISGGGRTFVLPNGASVERPSFQMVAWVKDCFSVTNISDMRAFAEGRGVDVSQDKYPAIPFNADVPLHEWPNFPHGRSIVISGHGDDDESFLCARDRVAAVWMTKRSFAALEAYAKAHFDRYQGELAVLEAMAKVLLAADRFGDVLDIWPEAEQRANDLFGPAPTNNALVAISNEDKVTICNALSRRGVTSQVCGSMISPAYDSVAA